MTGAVSEESSLGTKWIGACGGLRSAFDGHGHIEEVGSATRLELALDGRVDHLLHGGTAATTMHSRTGRPRDLARRACALAYEALDLAITDVATVAYDHRDSSLPDVNIGDFKLREIENQCRFQALPLFCTSF